jgi:serine/threonine protein phosphatase PrpC
MQVGGGSEAEVVVTHTLAARKPRLPEIFEAAAYQIRGQRDEQQDRFIIHKLSEYTLLVGVFDGHGDNGGRVAEVAARMIPTLLAARLGDITDAATIAKALHDAFVQIDEALAAKEKATDSGTTGVVVVITPTHYISANVGDSRAVLLRRRSTGDLVEGATLSVDHDTKNTAEVARARTAGAELDDEYFMVGDSGLQLSRALGDFGMKRGTPPILLCHPEIKTVRRSLSDDAFLWLFSDGVTDAMANYDHSWYIKVMNRMLRTGVKDVRLFARAVVKDAFAVSGDGKPVSMSGITSSDNITTLLVRLPESKRATIGAVTRRVGAGAGAADAHVPVVAHATPSKSNGTAKRKPRTTNVKQPSKQRGTTAKNTYPETELEPMLFR